MRPLVKLNRNQIHKLSDICSDVGLIALATIVLPAVFDKIDENKIVLGSLVVIGCWVVSLLLRK